jgi:P4 family phage/plasmid primase-like protien
VTVLAPWCDAVFKFTGRVAEEVARSWGKDDDGQGETPTEFSESTPTQGEEGPKGSRGPSRWIDPRDGLLVADLSQDITAGLPVMQDSGEGLWCYSGGVWGQDGTGRLRAEVVKRLGNRTRKAHTTNVMHYLLGVSDILRCDPLPDTLNVPNGLLDWRTGNLRPHSSDFHGTVQLAAEWDEGATCPGVTEWLRQVLPADLLQPTSDGGPGFIWEVLGYLCMSGNPLHKAVLLLGSGRNGKGTFLRMVTELLGSQNVSSVDLHSLVSNRFRGSELFGKVANIAGDLDGQWLESTALFKAITGGDTVTVERKYGHAFDFRPFAVPVYSANAVWGTPDTTAGYLSRWLVVPFPNTFLGAEDRGLDARLSEPPELSGVLANAVQGLRAVMARGNFSVPDSIAQAFDRFADESDPIRGFIRDTTVPDDDGWVTRAAVWETYEVWAKENGTRSPLSRGKLYARLAATGWTERMSNGNRGFIGRTQTVQMIEGIFPGQRHLDPVEGYDSSGGFIK